MISVLMAVSLALALYAVYYYVIKGEPSPTTGKNVLQGEEGVVDNPGQNEASVKDAPLRFTDPVMRGYTCLRCSDTGAGDLLQDPLDPQVAYTCPASRGTWERGGESTRLLFEERDKAFGNYASFVAVPGTVQDPLVFCADQCKQITEASPNGRCNAATYHKNKNICHFFYNCEKVTKSEDCDTIVIDFDVQKQPDVIG